MARTSTHTACLLPPRSTEKTSTHTASLFLPAVRQGLIITLPLSFPQYGKDFYSHCLPTFSPQYGKDFYYRAHPEDLKKFYAAVDEFHRIYDVVTEFESLNGLASEVMPGGCFAKEMQQWTGTSCSYSHTFFTLCLPAAYLAKRMSTIHPAVGPATADGIVAQFLLAK